jgi:hypothetical protein
MKGITKAGIGIGAVLVSLLILPGRAGAARPLTTDDAGTVEAGKFEMEAGYGHEDFGELNQGAGVALRHGITARMDLWAGTSWQFDPENGPEGLEMGVKWSLLPAEEKKPGISFTFGFAPGESEYSLNGIISQPWGEKVTLHLNAGYTVPEALADGAVFWGGAVEYAVHEKINLVGEIIGDEDLSDADEDCRSWLLGGNAAVTDFLTLDLGGGTRLSDDPGWFITGGGTLSF